MRGLIQGYGRALTATFFSLALLWGLLLIVLPQLTMLERAVTAPKRSLDSSIAVQLERDARTCISVLERYSTPDSTTATGGMALPSASAMAVPSASGMAIPSASSMAKTGQADNQTASRPYILQCDRATTHLQMVREPGAPSEWLDEIYGLELLSVRETDSIDDQVDTANRIVLIASEVAEKIRAEEAAAFPFTLANFQILGQARPIPLSEKNKLEENAKLTNKLLGVVGLRFEKDGVVHERISLITLTRTLIYAVAATALALLVCYPIAYKVALVSSPERAVWIFLGLVIPYAIVELMRVYAWTTIIDNEGLINGVLSWLGVISDPIQFKRFPGTIFVVIVYTYVLFMVFPMVNVMTSLDKNQLEAARDLGAKPWRVHWRIVIPHAKPGIAVGAIATFMLAAGAFSVPRIISRGLQAEWFSQTIYNKFFESENSNVGAAYSLVYTVICFVLVGLFMWAMKTRLKDFARVQ